MNSNLRLFSSVRSRVGNPSHDAVNDIAVLDAIVEAQTGYRTDMTLTNQNWLVGETTLTVNPNQSTYDIPEGPEGAVVKPIRVECYDPSDPESHGPEVEMVLLHDEDQVRSWEDGWRNDRAVETNEVYAETAYTASAFVIYDQPFKCRPVPRPAQQRTYRIYYQRTAAVNESLTAKPELPDDYHYLIVWKAAEIVLPMCGYDDSRFTQQMTVIQSNLKLFEKRFDKFIQRIKRPDSRRRKPYSPRNNRRYYR